MNRHMQPIRQNQGIIDLGDPRNELGAVDLETARQRRAFLAKFPSNWDDDRIERTILIGWRQGLYSSNEAINWLVICGFIKPARRANLDLWLENYALHLIGAAALPEAFETLKSHGSAE